MLESGSRQLVKSTLVAKLFGVSVRRVQQLSQEGIITAIKEQGGNQYDLLQVTQQYIRYLSDKAAGKEKDSPTADLLAGKLAAEIELKQTKARMAALELAEMEGQMHRAGDVEELTADLALAVRGGLLSLPGRLAVDILHCQTQAEVAARIQDAVAEMLTELAGYRYDPEVYRQKLRQRQGWEGQNAENTAKQRGGTAGFEPYGSGGSA